MSSVERRIRNALGDIVVNHQSDRLLTLTPIGHVESGVQKGEQAIWEELESRIVLDGQWAEGLQGLDEFSHIVVVFWLDRPSEAEVSLKVHPEAKEELPLVGLFATRTPLRPNPIGLTSVELLSVEGPTLRVRGLDAFDGTPVLDIKPYLVRGDLKPDASVPGWLRQLWERHDPEE
ncbi:MAG TPA: tRNA (N6-threonylcarbamoyladenosine(37)-N6)-methyltransferase TrmO [Anaerolineae bacterium]|nr:tRNA (N6-threonylcarbamoyladenosine(37)-N6)-methyltransferase TrmO [Anaerolineae bacterium]